MTTRMVFRRKVQLTGGSTLIVSLPKEWAKNAGVEHGSEVVIEVMPDYTLRITPTYTNKGGIPVEREVTVSCGDDATAAIVEVLAAYLAGYEKIRVRVEDGCPEIIREIVKRLQGKAIGLEILEETGDSVVFYSVMSSSTLSVVDALRKMISTTRCMLEDVKECLGGCEKEVLRGVMERDDVVDKLFLLVLRQLNQVLLGQLSPSSAGIQCLPEALYMLTSVKSIERIADHAVAMAVRILESEETALKRLEKLKPVYSMVLEAFKSSSKALLDPSKQSVRKALRALLEAGEALKQAEKQDRERDGAIQQMLESMKRVVAYSTDIIEATASIATLREIIQDRMKALQEASTQGKTVS